MTKTIKVSDATHIRLSERVSSFGETLEDVIAELLDIADGSARTGGKKHKK